jgi:hypothetical protein
VWHCGGDLRRKAQGLGKVVFRGRIWFSALEVMSCKEKRASIEKSVNVTKRYVSCGGMHFWPNILKSFDASGIDISTLSTFEVSEASSPNQRHSFIHTTQCCYHDYSRHCGRLSHQLDDRQQQAVSRHV